MKRTRSTDKKHRITFLPANVTVDARPGDSLLQTAGSAGINIGSLCGGKGVCGRCTMIVRKGTACRDSDLHLTPQQIQDGYVLGCQAYPETDAVVEIPSETAAAAGDTVIERFRASTLNDPPSGQPLAPLVRKIYLELEQPTLSSNFADLERLTALLRKKLGVSCMEAGLDVAKSLPPLLRKSGFKVTATVSLSGNCGRLLQVEGGDTESENYIAVVDMGTTTVVAHLVHAVSGRTLGSRACFNSQSVHGAEVTARIMAAEKTGCAVLQKLLTGDINRLVAGLAAECGTKVRNITAIVCAGNTVMGHFLLGLPVENIRRFPYIAASVEPPPVRASEAGITIHPAGMLYSLPGVGGWVGSDLTAGILATAMHESETTCLLVDIGTNGEVIVGNREWLMACSASAGPALEGASVESGMRAETGAIERVVLRNGAIQYETIGNGPARGICGSGIIDLVYVLLQAGIINRGGKMVTGSSDRIFEKEGTKGYTLVKKGERGCKKAVVITETDIQNIINAKAAIYAAMKIMVRRLDLTFADIGTFFIAGAFGNYLDVESAIGIGLIPNLPRERIRFVGNTSLKGAKMAALNIDAYDQVLRIERGTTYYDLMGAADYVEEFSKAMFLPHTDIESFL